MANNEWDDIFGDDSKPKNQKPSSTPPSEPANPTPSIDDPRTAGVVRAALANSRANIIAAKTDGRGRNNMLNEEGFNLGQLIENRLLTEAQVYDHLMDAARASGVYDEDGERQCDITIRSGITAGRKAGPRTNLPKMDAPDVTENPDLPPLRLISSRPKAENASKQEIDWGGVDGGTFIFNQPSELPTLWGKGESALWVEGESLMITGGQGLGKTTLAGQILHAQMFGGEVLDLPIRHLGPDEKVLYLAMDRPRQIARSLARQFWPSEREQVEQHLIVRPGPPITDLAKHPDVLTAMCEHFNASIVYVDSLKDAAIGLVEDEVGALWNRARQTVINAGVQICELHHNKKHKTGDNWDISDVYGSQWITGGVGSVIMLTGQPGDPIIGFRHIKKPSDEVGPFRLEHDETAGQMTIWHDVDLLELALASQPDGLTARAAASAIFDVENPGRGDVEKARRRLDAKVDEGVLVRVGGVKGGAVNGAKGGAPAVWHPATGRAPWAGWEPSDGDL